MIPMTPNSRLPTSVTSACILFTVLSIYPLYCVYIFLFFFFSSRRRHTRFDCDWSSDVCSSDLESPRKLRHQIRRNQFDQLSKHRTVLLARLPVVFFFFTPCLVAGKMKTAERTEKRRVGEKRRTRGAPDH